MISLAVPSPSHLRSKLIALSSKFDTVNGRAGAGGRPSERASALGRMEERCRTITHSAPADLRCPKDGREAGRQEEASSSAQLAPSLRYALFF